jgi:hypothetical protein
MGQEKKTLEENLGLGKVYERLPLQKLAESVKIQYF